jgi:hypothetical protein
MDRRYSSPTFMPSFGNGSAVPYPGGDIRVVKRQMAPGAEWGGSTSPAYPVAGCSDVKLGGLAGLPKIRAKVPGRRPCSSLIFRRGFIVGALQRSAQVLLKTAPPAELVKAVRTARRSSGCRAGSDPSDCENLRHRVDELQIRLEATGYLSEREREGRHLGSAGMTNKGRSPHSSALTPDGEDAFAECVSEVGMFPGDAYSYRRFPGELKSPNAPSPRAYSSAVPSPLGCFSAPLRQGPIRCQARLGGLLKYYHRNAA